MKRVMLMAVGLGLLLGGQVRAGNLIVNPGFETGDFTGWTVVHNSNGVLGIKVYSGTLGGLPVAHTGTYAAIFGNYYEHPDSIYQDVPTLSGQSYQIEFWLENTGGPQNSFDVSWGGISLLSLQNSSVFGYTEYTFTESASASATTLEFSGTQTPAAYCLDDVSVVPMGASVPEPASIALFGIGAVGAMGYTYARRSRRQRAAKMKASSE
jgi:PEP-CTERM motif